MDITDLNPSVPESDSETQTTGSEEAEVTLAPCGMNCTECRFAAENDCPGCMQGRLFEDEECEIFGCCMKKGIKHCGFCSAFPCDTLKAAALDKETGDGGARLMRLKSVRDGENRIKRRRMSDITLGIALGIACGTIIGELSGNLFVWLFTFIAVGAALGCIAGISGRN